MKNQRKHAQHVVGWTLALAVFAIGLALPLASGTSEARKSRSGSVAGRTMPLGAQVWTTGGPSGMSISSIAVDPANANNILAGSYGNGVFRSTDGGGSWIPLASGVTTNSYISSLAIDPSNPATVFVGANGSVLKSTNGGEDWLPSGSGMGSDYVSTLAVDPIHSNVIYAGTGYPLLKSTDSGGNWSAIGVLSSPQSLVIDPANSGIIYAISYYDDYSKTLYKSVDGGVNWNRSDSGGFYCVTALVIDPKNTATLYAADTSFGLNKSSDGGGSWSVIGAGLPLTDSAISSLAIDPVKPNVIYAGTWGSGVFRSTDAGASWNPLNDGLNDLNINALVIAPSGNSLHAGTGAGVFDIQVAPPGGPNTVQFSSANYSVSEGSPRVDITLSRSGDTSGAALVSYATNDGAGLQNCDMVNGKASPRCDFENTIGTVQFAAGETSKSFSVAIVDDSYAEGNESFTINLTGASGTTLDTQTAASVMIMDNDNTNGADPIDDTNFFVRQQYIDFLGREPDPPGFDGWVNTINNCSGNTTQCDRVHVSEAFFKSPEFQQRGYFTYRFYSVGLGRKPDYAEFVPDLARVSGFLDASQLEAAKVAFIADFMTRPAFANTYNGLANQQYVDTLLNTASVTLSSRQSMIDRLDSGTTTRAQVLRQIVESGEVSTKYFNQSFAVMEYFGYLRRDPDAMYLNWIDVLDQGGDSRSMVDGFVNSPEYRLRFGP